MISIIISTYDRPDALRCVLRGLNQQINTEFEVVVADDGSNTETKKVIETFRLESNYSVKHIWQEDHGFRAAKIRNKAVADATGDYLIFLDGDCVPFPQFVSQHKSIAEPGYFVRGSRVMLSQLFTIEFIEKNINASQLTITDILKLRAQKKINRFMPLLDLPIKILRKQKKNEWYGVKTCNLGVWSDDFIAVNGFDERYVGWGHEDADLAIRLINNHVYRKEGIYAVTVLHLWHEFNDRSNLSDNVARLQLVQQSSVIHAQQGVSQYL